MGRSPCCSKEGLNYGAWTKTEDMILFEYIRIHGDGRWTNLPQKAGLNRCGKSCRLRWLNYLRPDIKLGNISPDEEELIVRMHRLLGNRWSLIAGRLPGRTDNEIKNYWNTHLKKKVLMDECQNKMRNLKTREQSLSSQNGVIKTTPVKLTTPVRYSEIIKPNRCSNVSNSDHALKMFNVQETTNSSKSWCDLFVNDSIPEDDSERVAFGKADGNLVETEADWEFLHSNQFAGNAGFGFEDFHSGPATLDAEMNELQYQTNLRQENSFTVPGYPRMKEIYDSTEPVDWNHVLNDILN